MRTGWAVLLVLGLLSWTSAQTSGVVSGIVQDATTKEPLPRATIRLEGSNGGTLTGLDGRFVLKDLSAGNYRVSASMVGYGTLVKSDVIVAPGKQVELVYDLVSTALEQSEIIVTPSYFETSTAPVVSAQTLSNEEIRRSPGGFEDVVRNIAILPGVAQSNAGRNDLIVRGGSPSENLYVVDGHEVPNINHFGTQGSSGGPLSFVNIDFVREVTFSTGGFGSRYGDRLSSVTDITLEDGRTDRNGGKLTLSASQFGFNSEGPLGGNGSYFFSARRSYLDFIFKAAGFGFVPEYWDFAGKMVLNPTTHDQISFTNIGALDNVKFVNSTADQRYNNSTVLGNSQDQYFSGLTWRHLITGGAVTSALTRTFVKYRYLQSDSLLNPIFKGNSRESETGLRSSVLWKVGSRSKLEVGGQAKMMRQTGSMYLPRFGTQFGDTIPTIDLGWSGYATKGAAFADWSGRATDFMNYNLGLRGDYFDQIERKFAISPRAGVSYALTAQTTLNLVGGIYRQSPSYVWLNTNAYNRSLPFMRTDQAVVGVEHRWRPDTRIRLEGYWKSYRDYPASLKRSYLVMANAGGGFGGSEDDFSSFGFDSLSAVGSGITRGIELLVQKRMSEVPVFGIASVTYNRTDYRALDGILRSGAYDQRWIVNLSGGYLPTPVWEIGAKFRYGSGMPYTPFDSNGKRSSANFLSKRMPDFHSMDLRIDRRWNRSDWTMITYVDLQNVYNHKNVSGYTWNKREQKEEANTDIGLLPSIGISIEY